jgi:hypothetical protein
MRSSNFSSVVSWPKTLVNHLTPFYAQTNNEPRNDLICNLSILKLVYVFCSYFYRKKKELLLINFLSTKVLLNNLIAQQIYRVGDKQK